MIRVATDVGGTFSDSIAYDPANGRITVAKVSTTPANPALGTMAGLARALSMQGRCGRDVAYVGHGMTTATNAVIQRTGARTAFVTNAGFRDLLQIGRQNRPSLYDLSVVRNDQLVPRERCYTVAGRMDASGHEIVALDEPALHDIAALLLMDRVEAVAVTFLHAYANPAHERRAAAVLRQALPGVVVCISTDVLSEFREFERASVTVLNAYLVPILDKYLASLVQLLESPAGLGLAASRPVMVMEAAGGVMTVDGARAKPVHTVLSGPAGGVVAANYIAAACGVHDLITMDIGGTSTDISLIRGNRPEVTREAVLESLPIRLPVIDIHAIGAGGGSIAWIDDGGALRVGPRSAEARPGPACYGHGGLEPTVSDANLVLGRMGAGTRLGGELLLDATAAHEAIARVIATPLGIDVHTAAVGILRVAHANIVRGIRVVSVERGLDPRDFVLVPFGGAGAMHGTPVARDLGLKRLLIPPNPGILCAFGLLVSDLRHDLLETFIRPLAGLPYEEVLPVLGRLGDTARCLLERDGVEACKQQVELRADLRYIGQSYELTISLGQASRDDWMGIANMFHSAHQTRFGHCNEQAPLEVVSFSVVGLGAVDRPKLLPIANASATAAAVPVSTRAVFFETDTMAAAGDWHQSAVYQRAALGAGTMIAGPAIIDEVSATTVLYPGDTCTVHGNGSLLVQVGP